MWAGSRFGSTWFHRRNWLIALVIVLSPMLASQAGSAQGLLPTLPPSLEERGRFDLGCGAGIYNLEGFKDLLTESERERLAFEVKMRHGNYERSEEPGPWFVAMKARSMLEHVQGSLHRVDVYGRTAALLYSLTDYGHRRVLCAWLVTTTDFLVAQVDMPDRPLPQLVQDGLGVTTRAAARAPVRRDASAARPASNAAPDSLTPAPRALLEQTAQQMLPSSLRPRLLSGEITRLLILAAADLSTVPFAALPVDGDHALVDVASIVILPDVNVLLWPKPAMARPLRGDKLVIGDPDVSRDRVWKMPPLPQARAEAIEIASLFGATALVDKGATRDAVMARLRMPSIDLAYFATHGITDGVDPMDRSFLALAGGHLFARDIKRLKLAGHPLVVMSACQSALGKVFRGGVFGLARAWFYAGAPQVVMSLWNIEDAPTRRLMTGFMAKIAKGMPAELALQEAMRETRPDFNDPALWASFAVYGEPTFLSARTDTPQ